MSIEEALDRALAEGAKAWPTLTVDRDAMRRALRARVETAADPAAALADLVTADLYLAQACAAADPVALRILDEQFLARIPAMLARHRARESADEIRQLIREKLLVGSPPRIVEFGGRSPLAAWLRVVVMRAASNFTRGAKQTTPVDEDVLGALAEVPELRVLEDRYKQAFRAAFRAAFERLAPEERTLLRLHFVDGASVRKLAPILGVSTATAGRRVLAAQTRLGELALHELGERSGASPSELRSVVRTLLSRLDVSLSVLLPS
jgi:RNA polymerase sigma-70 factor (ECF subfamily)